MNPDHVTLVTPSLEGITTVIAAFLLFCFVRPALVRNRTQFMAAFACLLGIVVLQALRMIAYNSSAIQVVTGVLTGLLQLGALVLIVLFSGGMSIGQLGSEMGRAYEVIRRGEEEKEVIIPLTGAAPRPRDKPPGEPTPRPRQAITEPTQTVAEPRRPKPREPEDRTPISLD